LPRRNSKQILFADAFAGCGGLSLGLMQAGCKGLVAIEKDKFAFDTLKSNLIGRKCKFSFSWPRWLPKEPFSIDALLSKHREHLEGLQEKIDLLVGGPPCQGFSSAGKRKHDDPRNKLFKSYLKLIDLLKPRAVLIENVRGFTMKWLLQPLSDQ
jgi:DNA (cytosine-5)-methyltransferase 1